MTKTIKEKKVSPLAPYLCISRAFYKREKGSISLTVGLPEQGEATYNLETHWSLLRKRFVTPPLGLQISLWSAAGEILATN